MSRGKLHLEARIALANRRYEQALDLGENSVRLSNGLNWLMFRRTIAARAYLGRIDEAGTQVGRTITLHPDIIIGSFREVAHYVCADDIAYSAEGLRKGGMLESRSMVDYFAH